MLPRCRPELLVLLAVVACKGTEPFVPHATTVNISPSSVTFNSIGATRPVTATVLDQRGDPMTGATVTWSSNNDGVATANPSQPASAVVSAVGSGSTQIVATSASVSGQMTVTVAQVVGQLVKVAGDGQTGTVGQQLPIALAAQANDSNGHPIQNAILSFQVTQGGGSLSAPSDTSGPNGQVQVSWTIGTTAGAPQSVQATASTLPAAPVTFAANAVAGPPANLARQGGDSQTTAVSTVVPTAPAVRVRDAFDNPVRNVVVDFAVSAGGGSLDKPTDTTDVNGVASVGSWRLGSSPGQNDLTATVASPALTFTFIATGVTPGLPASVVVSAGNNQTGLLGYPLNVSPAVLVRDASNFPVANAQVDFVHSGAGSVTGSPAFTNVDGIATVGSWTVEAGANMLTATVTGSGISGNPVTLNGTGVTAAYNIEVRFMTPVTPAQQAAFDSAEARWERLVFGDVPDGQATFPSTCSGLGGPVDEVIDDIIIFARLDSIDGQGAILGQASPCLVRNSSFQPAVGLMRFDTADVATLLGSDQFDEVILHEMAHVLGYGTIWGTTALNLRVGAGSADPYFIGAQAIAAFDRSGGQGYSGPKVPLENTGGGGTRDVHWRESVFNTELMTGFIDAGANPLSVISTGSLLDLGYTVNYAASDAYVVANPLALRGREGAQISFGDDILQIPIVVVDRYGRVVRVIQPR